MFFDEMEKIDAGMSIDSPFARENRKTKEQGRRGGHCRESHDERIAKEPTLGRRNVVACIDEQTGRPWWEK